MKARHLPRRRAAIGALIVLQNEVGLNEYIEVGTRLDAQVSKELVTSIFLPGSPIHDGALIIQHGRITAAGCFLPLTTNPNVSKTLGTRHRAAIGLTEETDARRDRRLRGGRHDLARARGQDHARRRRGDAAHHAAAAARRMRLRALRPRRGRRPRRAAARARRGRRRRWRRWLRAAAPASDLREPLRRNPGLKLVSLLLAFFLWFSINVTRARRRADRRAAGDACRKLPPGLIVTNPPAKPVAVTLRGPRTHPRRRRRAQARADRARPLRRDARARRAIELERAT